MRESIGIGDRVFWNYLWRKDCSAEKVKWARSKAIAIKVAVIVARVVWIAMGFAITLYTMYVVAVVLGVCIPEGTSTWVRFVIGVPCIFIAPLCVELLYIAISKRIDRLSDYKVLGLRFS